MSRSSRRAFLGTLGAAAVVLPEFRSPKFPEAIGTLQPGALADVTVIDLQKGRFELLDQRGQKRTATQRIVPVAAVHGGKVAKIDPAVHEAKFAGVRI
jgi:predicted amidohydrolase